MTYGKSQAACIIAKESIAINPSTRIGVTCKSVYKRLVEQGVPEVNLIKMWEQDCGISFDKLWIDEETK